jgi:hypothetical protein
MTIREEILETLARQKAERDALVQKAKEVRLADEGKVENGDIWLLSSGFVLVNAVYKDSIVRFTELVRNKTHDQDTSYLLTGLLVYRQLRFPQIGTLVRYRGKEYAILTTSSIKGDFVNLAGFGMNDLLPNIPFADCEVIE